MRLSLAAALAALCLLAPAARAQSRYEPPETHRGLFLRLQGGVGYLHASADYNPGSATSYGGSGMLGLAVGGAVSEDVVLYGELWGIAAANPTVQVGSVSGIARDTSLNYGGIGLGLGRFFMPSNIFIGISLDLTRLGVTNSDGTQNNSDIGLAVTGMIGKQWWISDHCGLGLSLQLIGGGNRDNNNDANSATYKTFSGIGALTFTYG